MFKRNFSFKRQLLMVFLVVGIIPLFLLWIYDTLFIIKSTYDKFDYYTNSNINIASRLIDNNINTYENIVKYIAEDPDVQRIISKENNKEYLTQSKFNDTQQLYQISNAILATQTIQIPLHIVNLDKSSRFSTTNYYFTVYNDTRGNFYEKLNKNEDRVVTQVHRRIDGKDSQDTVLVIGKSIVDKNTKEIIGYVIADVYDSYFDDIFEDISFVKDSNIILMDDNGYIITDKNDKNFTGFKFNSKYLNQMTNNQGVLNVTLENEDYKGYYITTTNTKIRVMELVPEKYFLKEVFDNMRVLFVLTFFVVTAAICFVLIMSKRISKPIIEMRVLMKEVERGNLKVFLNNSTNDEIGELSRGFNDMVHELNMLIEQDYKKELLVQKAEFKALKSQVNPHFLYNSLGLINWLARLGESESVIETTDALAEFFRYNVNTIEDIATVEKEFEQIKSYLIIQNYRYKDSLAININIEEGIKKYSILKLMLQPLVENAIIHGLEEKVGQGLLIINGFEEGDNLCFQIKDNGVGLNNSKKKGEGVGIDNVNKRIKLFYGEDYGISYNKEEQFTVFSVTVPKKERSLSD